MAVGSSRAGEAGGPPQPLQVVQAVRIGPEPGLELAHGPRIVSAGTRVIHHLSLHRLSGDPGDISCDMRPRPTKLTRSKGGRRLWRLAQRFDGTECWCGEVHVPREGFSVECWRGCLASGGASAVGWGSSGRPTGAAVIERPPRRPSQAPRAREGEPRPARASWWRRTTARWCRCTSGPQRPRRPIRCRPVSRWR